MITLIGNLKGGTGKSTVNFNMALWLAAHGRPPLVFDLDPQRTLSDALEVRNDQGYTPALEPLHHISWLLPGERRDVLIDVGASDMPSMHAAIRAADCIVIPVTPSQADVWSTQRFARMIRTFRQGGPMPRVLSFINRAGWEGARTETEEAAAALRTLPGQIHLATRLSHSHEFLDSFSEGLAVFEQDPESRASRELDGLARAVFP